MGTPEMPKPRPRNFVHKKDAGCNTRTPGNNSQLGGGGSKNRGTQTPPKWMVKIMENPYFLMDDLGGKTPIFRKHLLVTSCVNE